MLGNLQSAEDVDVLLSALDDEEPLVRSAAASALGRIGDDVAATRLRERWPEEGDESVRVAITAALATVSKVKLR